MGFGQACWLGLERPYLVLELQVAKHVAIQWLYPPALLHLADSERGEMMSFIEETLAANERYASNFKAGQLQMPPARAAAVLVCMDARLDPAKFLGLSEGDAHVIRNAGGRASEDAIRSLVISSQLLGTREYLVVHHTDCGMLTFSNEHLREKLRTEQGADASGVDFLPFSDLDQSVRDDVERIAKSPLIARGIPITGLIYHVTDGRLRKVVEATTGES